MNDPVSEPAHAVTPPEPVPVVLVKTRQPADVPTLELVEQLNSLLRMKVLVEPVRKHEEVRDHKDRVRRHSRPLPVTEWDIHIFEGGRIPVPAALDGPLLADQINAQLALAIRPFIQAQVALALSLLAEGAAPTLEASKQVAECARSIDELRKLTVMYSNGAVVARRCAFRATDLNRATAFERSVNDLFHLYTGSQVTALRAIIAERFKALT